MAQHALARGGVLTVAFTSSAVVGYSYGGPALPSFLLDMREEMLKDKVVKLLHARCTSPGHHRDRVLGSGKVALLTGPSHSQLQKLRERLLHDGGGNTERGWGGVATLRAKGGSIHHGLADTFESFGVWERFILLATASLMSQRELEYSSRYAVELALHEQKSFAAKYDEMAASIKVDIDIDTNTDKDLDTHTATATTAAAGEASHCRPLAFDIRWCEGEEQEMKDLFKWVAALCQQHSDLVTAVVSCDSCGTCRASRALTDVGAEGVVFRVGRIQSAKNILASSESMDELLSDEDREFLLQLSGGDERVAASIMEECIARGLAREEEAEIAGEGEEKGDSIGRAELQAAYDVLVERAARELAHLWFEGNSNCHSSCHRDSGSDRNRESIGHTNLHAHIADKGAQGEGSTDETSVMASHLEAEAKLLAKALCHQKKQTSNGEAAAATAAVWEIWEEMCLPSSLTIGSAKPPCYTAERILARGSITTAELLKLIEDGWLEAIPTAEALCHEVNPSYDADDAEDMGTGNETEEELEEQSLRVQMMPLPSTRSEPHSDISLFDGCAITPPPLGSAAFKHLYANDKWNKTMIHGIQGRFANREQEVLEVDRASLQEEWQALGRLRAAIRRSKDEGELSEQEFVLAQIEVLRQERIAADVAAEVRSRSARLRQISERQPTSTSLRSSVTGSLTPEEEVLQDIDQGRRMVPLDVQVVSGHLGGPQQLQKHKHKQSQGWWAWMRGKKST